MVSIVASGEVGQSVRAGPLPPAYAGKCAGLAGHDGQAYTIALSEDLEPGALLEALYHECAHFALGHVHKRKAAGRLPAGLALGILALATDPQEEAAAEAWARARLGRMDPITRAVMAVLLAG